MAVMFFWWKDIIFESVKENVHNGITEVGLRLAWRSSSHPVMFFVVFLGVLRCQPVRR